jgi:hypothetical protein
MIRPSTQNLSRTLIGGNLFLLAKFHYLTQKDYPFFLLGENQNKSCRYHPMILWKCQKTTTLLKEGKEKLSSMI